MDQVDDERAETCRVALGGKAWDLAAALAAAVGSDMPDGGQLERLRGLAQLPAPAADGVDSAAAGLREAADGLDAVAGTAAGQAKALAALLAAALEHHSSHGDGDCPVCGRSGALTPQWQQETHDQLASLRRQSGAADKAAQSAAVAADRAPGAPAAAAEDADRAGTRRHRPGAGAGSVAALGKAADQRRSGQSRWPACCG